MSLKVYRADVWLKEKSNEVSQNNEARKTTKKRGRKSKLNSKQGDK